MPESNGKTLTVPSQNKPAPYRPDASTQTVHNAVIRSLASIVSTAARESADFVYLAEQAGSNEDTATRLGHLVDATECLEIALTHLGQLKGALSHRLRIEDERNCGEKPF